MSIRAYSELILLPTFEERYFYLRLGGRVGEETFGFDRYLNQLLYKSDEWLSVRDYVIIRDTGSNDYCQDLGMDYGRDIHSRIFVHHMNPITKEDILNHSKFVFDPEYLISTTKRTHDAIHYGDDSLLLKDPIERSPNDTCLWK